MLLGARPAAVLTACLIRIPPLLCVLVLFLTFSAFFDIVFAFSCFLVRRFCDPGANAGGTKSEDFLKVNPAGLIPAIDDNGFFLGESNAILPYLAEQNSWSSW